MGTPWVALCCLLLLGLLSVAHGRPIPCTTGPCTTGTGTEAGAGGQGLAGSGERKLTRSLGFRARRLHTAPCDSSRPVGFSFLGMFLHSEADATRPLLHSFQSVGPKGAVALDDTATVSATERGTEMESGAKWWTGEAAEDRIRVADKEGLHFNHIPVMEQGLARDAQMREGQEMALPRSGHWQGRV